MSHPRNARRDGGAAVIPIRPVPAAPAPAKRPRKPPKHLREGSGEGGRRLRGESPHPGVILQLPAATGRRWPRAIVFDDPSDARVNNRGERKYRRSLAGMTDRQAFDWCVDKSAAMRRQRDDAAISGEHTAQVLLWSPSVDVDSALRRYLELDVGRRRNKRDQPRAATTLTRYTRDCLDFVSYCEANKVTHSHQVSIALIAGWRDARAQRAADNRDGSERKASTLNQELRSVRQWLKAMARDGMLRPALTADRTYGALKLRTEREPARRIVRVSEYTDHLRAVIRYDARARRVLTTAALLGLKSGLRREEATLVQVRDIIIGGEWGAVIELPADKAKYGKARTIQALPFSPVLVELLTALVLNRSPDEYVLDATYDSIGNAFDKLHKPSYGVSSELTAHAWRRTAISYATPMQVSDAVRREQFGNSADVSAKHYESVRGELPIHAESIDAVVADRAPHALALERAILDAEWARAWARKPARRVQPRVAQRVGPVRAAMRDAVPKTRRLDADRPAK